MQAESAGFNNQKIKIKIYGLAKSIYFNLQTF